MGTEGKAADACGGGIIAYGSCGGFGGGASVAKGEAVAARSSGVVAARQGVVARGVGVLPDGGGVAAAGCTSTTLYAIAILGIDMDCEEC